jgi:hypothetical protein
MIKSSVEIQSFIFDTKKIKNGTLLKKGLGYKKRIGTVTRQSKTKRRVNIA